MSDYEMIMVMLTILGLIIPLLSSIIALIIALHTKK